MQFPSSLFLVNPVRINTITKRIALLIASFSYETTTAEFGYFQIVFDEKLKITYTLA